MKLINKAILPIFILLRVNSALAMDEGMSPGMMPLGPFDLTPLFGFQESYNDNIFHSNSDFNAKSSFVTQIKAGGEVGLRRKLDRYALSYSMLSSQYHSSPADDYIDHYLDAKTHFELSNRNRLDLNAGVAYAHNMRGTFFTQGPIATQINEPDQYHTYSAGLNYRFGQVEAPANLGLQFNWAQQTYDNHLERTTIRDITEIEITPAFYYRLMPKTYLTTQVENSIVSYPTNDNANQSEEDRLFSLDYDKQRYLLGVTWDQSSKTKGSFRIGYFQQAFSRSDIKSIGGISWDGKIIWSPLTYSSFNFGFLRDTQPSIGLGYARQMQVYDLGWTHTWPKRVTTLINGSYQETLSQGAGQQNGSGLSYAFDIKYAMRPWLNMGFNYSHSAFQSSTNNTNTPQNVFMFYINAVAGAGDTK